jgi:uncharacterized protein
MASNLETIKAAYDAFAVGDVPTVLVMLDPDIHWTEAAGTAYGDTYHGPDDVVNGVFMRLATEWDGYRVTPDRFVDGGDQIVALGRYGGTFKETGKALDCDFARYWEFRDGKAVRFHQYTDSALWAEAMSP